MKTNNTSIKLKIEKFFVEQLWQLLLVVAFLFICAFVFNKYIESFLFCISHTLIRNAFRKQFHCGKTAICLSFTIAIAWVGVTTTLPLDISIISSLPICFIIAFLGFIAQDRLDIYVLNKNLSKQIQELKTQQNIDLLKMTPKELRLFGASKGLTDLQQDILVYRIDVNLMEWNVYYFDINGQKIDTFNVFRHYSFLKEVKKELKKWTDKKIFASELRTSLMYFFWCKAEWELIIENTEDNHIYLKPWCGCKNTDEARIDVTDNTDFDWRSFAEEHIGKQVYIDKAKIDVHDQVMMNWNLFLDYVWDNKKKLMEIQYD